MKCTAPLVQRLSLLGSFVISAALTGCGVSDITTSVSSDAPVTMTGSVHGGIQPITGAQIQLFAVGSGGNGSPAQSLLTTPVYTDSHSDFSITGDYSCPTGNAQVYLVATGGNPGFTSNVNNPASVLLSPLGSCQALLANPSRPIAVNEVSTVAAVYALAPFMTAYNQVGSSAKNTAGIGNAFLDAQLLVDTSTGVAAQLPSNLAIEAGKLYGLADAIVPCVNSDGGAACAPLFSAATVNGVAPTDVLGALLNIVKHPGNNVAAVFKLIGSTPPYPTTLTSTPSDWTMSLSVTGGGLVEPTQLAIDKSGNVWVTNYGDPGPAGVVAFSPQGTPFSGTPFGAGVQTDAYGLTLDKNGDVWVTSYQNVQSGGSYGSVAKFGGAASASPGGLVGQYSDPTLSQPEAITSDPAGSGTVLISNYHTGTVTFYDLNGAFLKNIGNGVPNGPNAITSDNAGGAWVGDQGDQDIVHLFANGTTQVVACCNAVQTINLDLHGNIWTSNFVGVGNPPAYTFSEIAADGTVLINEKSGGGLFSPGSGVIDAGGQFWVANYYGYLGSQYGSFSEIAGNDTSVAAGTPLSPASGFGLDAKMSLAYADAVDPSGNLWISVRGGNSLRMFFGLATPTATPTSPTPQAP